MMTRKRFSEEDILNILRQIELDLAAGGTVEVAIRTAGISDATYYKWRKMYGGMGRSKLHEFKEMEKENTRLKRIVAELELDKLILKESLDYLKPKA
ncbi:MAG: transposase [Rhodospirillales bacterium]|nr:transposase [Rhodospirillales bacterium]